MNERLLPNNRYFDSAHPMLRGFRHIQLSMPLHRQEFAEVVFVFGGKAEYHTGPGAAESIGRGDILVVPPNGRHGYFDADQLDIFALLFVPDKLPLPLLDLYTHLEYKSLFGYSAEYYESIKRDYPHLTLKEEVFAEFEPLVSAFIRFQSLNTPGSDCEKLGLFMCIIARLCDIWHVSGKNTSSAPPLDMNRLIAYLSENFSRPLSLRKLAAQSAMSPNTLLRHFRKMLGGTPMNYVRKLRLEAAAKLLLSTTLRIDEIADRCGFYGSSGFIANFRRAYGTTPGRFRAGGKSRKFR